MGFRFQKRIKLLPGISLNFSKSGISTSVGVKGARVTFGNGKTRTTVGLPGTGISHTSVTSTSAPKQSPTEIIPSGSRAQDLQPSGASTWLSVVVSVVGHLLIGVSVAIALIFAFFLGLIGSSSKKRRRY